MMKPAAKEIVPSRGVNNDQMGMENTSEKKCFGFSVGSHFPSEPKTRPAWRFRHNSRVVLLCVALCLTVLSSFVSYESSTPRMYTALSAAAADVDTDSLVDTDSWTESGEEGTTVDDGATEADDGAVELQGDAAEAEGGANELYGTDFENQPKIIRLARTWLRKDPRVAALVSKVERFGRERPMVLSGIVAGVALSVILSAVFLKSGRKPGSPAAQGPSSRSAESSQPALAWFRWARTTHPLLLTMLGPIDKA
ncbi:Toxoplasma gondii family C protein [Toxoplasma gondii VAND]|uniref:Toxoplasma gondii family C protein n=1 Tax=Toxoplasma gondii VAND TaxID=933077 RepID=A0A086PHH3_TOXGO|nr:Toxoplasma gondii family C protein [Toxoplasma gondii VAND]